jgi:hypothetical protein
VFPVCIGILHSLRDWTLGVRYSILTPYSLAFLNPAHRFKQLFQRSLFEIPCSLFLVCILHFPRHWTFDTCHAPRVSRYSFWAASPGMYTETSGIMWLSGCRAFRSSRHEMDRFNGKYIYPKHAVAGITTSGVIRCNPCRGFVSFPV